MNERKRSVLYRMICLIMVFMFSVTTFSIPAYGVTESVDASEMTEEVQEYEEMADSWRFQDGENITQESTPMTYGLRAAFVPWSKTEDGFINSKGQIISGAIKKGVDVSAWQDKIDWGKVKSSDVDFAIIRCGFGSDQKNQDDKQWSRNVKECERLGIPYGVYLYSYADTRDKAKSEAQHTLRLLKEVGADPDYPVYYDLEDKITRAKSRSEIVKYAEIFCSTIEAAGYEAGIYANYDWWTNVLYEIPKDPAFDQYDRWVAQYYYRCDYKDSEYRLWQSTSSGTVPGISGNVDVNFEFKLKNETNRTTNIWAKDKNGNTVYIDSEGEIAKSEWIKYRGNTYYVNKYGKRLTGRCFIGDKRYYFNKYGKLVKNSWLTISGYKYYATSDGSFAKGYKKIGDYYYLFNSDTGVMRTGTVTVGSKQYKLYSSGKACLHTAKTTTALNYRTGPSTKYKNKGTYKKGKTVYVIRTYNGWSKLSTGYWVNSKYLSKITVYPKTVSSFKSYKAKVTASTLYYRTGPSTSYTKKGYYKKGKIITIVAVKNGWGKTSSGYWVSLSYVKRI